MHIADLLLELHKVEHQAWFVREIAELDLTDDALRVRLDVGEGLVVQVFLSETTGRCSFALVQGNQRIYGRDRENGAWHRHPYQEPSSHELTPEGVSPYPLRQFLAEVQEILLIHELI